MRCLCYLALHTRCITRSTATTSTLIDHIYLSENLSYFSCSTEFPLHAFDHSTIHLCLTKPHPPTKKVIRRKVWLYKQADFESANAILQCLSSESFPANDINSLLSQWHDFYMTTMSQSIPSKVVKSSSNLPYLSKDLVAATQKKACLFRRARRLGTTKAWQKYSMTRNRVTAALRRAKAAYFEELSSKLRSPKDFWSAYHKLLPKKDRIPVDLHLGNLKATTSTQNANLLNYFCSTCFSPPSVLKPTGSPPSNGPSLTSVTRSQHEILEVLSTHKIRTAAGPDGISSQMLHATAESITPTITRIFNESLSQAKVPSEWKISNVTPIPKGGDPTSPSNYRPVSLLSLIIQSGHVKAHSR